MNNLWEKAVVLALEPFVNSNSIIIDCGANIGGVSQALADGLDGNGLLISIEPNINLESQIRENLSRINCQSIVIPKAAWHESGKWLDLFIDKSYYSTGSSLLRSDVGEEKLSVETIALDDIPEADSKKLDIIKIDVEGAEYSVLQGSSNIIKAHKPTICIEISADNLSALNYLKKFEYRFYIVNSYEEVDITSPSLLDGVWNILAVPAHIKFEIERRLIDNGARKREYILSPGLYVFSVQLDDTINCHNSIGVAESDSGNWVINYEIEMKHLKHPTNSSLPVSTSKTHAFTVKQGFDCGHDHVKNINLAKVEIFFDGNKMKPKQKKYSLLSEIKLISRKVLKKIRDVYA